MNSMHFASLVGTLLIYCLASAGVILSHSSCTAALNSAKVLQPLAVTRLCTKLHRFSMGLRSGLFGGQLWTSPMVQLPCLLQLLTVFIGSVWALSLSCCSSQAYCLCLEKMAQPSLRSDPYSAAVYSSWVMFLDLMSFLVA
jgi:hypothetical protein